MQCGAKTRDGDPCKNPPMRGAKRCRMHGGKSPRGLAHPSTKHGRRSIDLPTRMLADYEAERGDPDLLNLSDSIAVTRARRSDLFRQLEQSGSASLFLDLLATWQQFERAQRAKDGEAMSVALQEVGRLIKRGATDASKWREIMALQEQERKLVESEQKRRVAMNTMLTAEKGQLLVRALLASVNSHVSDKSVLAAIGSDIMELVGEGAG